MHRIERLTLHQFRSYPSLRLDVGARSVALTGPNGAGKTNILEALSFIAPGRGLRRATLAEALHQNGNPSEGWGVGLQLSSPDDPEPVQMNLMALAPPPFRKMYRQDGAPISPSGDSFAKLHFAWITPAQDRLFLDGPSERRRFLDRMAMAYDGAHGQVAAGYEHALRQRQAALALPRPDYTTVAALERQMAETGVALAAARRTTAGMLASGYAQLRSGDFPAARLALEGWVEEALADGPASDVEELFVQKLHASRRQDMAAGRALIGPHRADLHVTHAEKDQPARLCSTGEQKALLVGLILAHAAALMANRDGALILLLDEIAAHLDRFRRAALADILDRLGCQVFMTGTDRELFEAWGDRIARFDVADGRAVAH